MAAINKDISAIANMLALANQHTVAEVTLDESTVTFGTPTEWTDPEGINARNTVIDIVAVAESGYTGNYPVYYTRQDLEAFRFGVNLEITLTESSTVETVIQSLADTLAINADEVELRDDLDALIETLPEITEATLVTLAAIADSMLYIGDVSVTLQPIADEQMSAAMSTDQMDGFDEPTQG